MDLLVYRFSAILLVCVLVLVLVRICLIPILDDLFFFFFFFFWWIKAFSCLWIMKIERKEKDLGFDDKILTLYVNFFGQFDYRYGPNSYCIWKVIFLIDYWWWRKCYSHHCFNLLTMLQSVVNMQTILARKK